MKKMINVMLLLAFMGGVTGCSPKVTETVQNAAMKSSAAARALPSHRIYKMRGDYAAFVPVTLDAEGKTIVSYPAPTDINPSQKPVALGNGWYLDRRGVGVNTAFTDFTYEEYAQLATAPSIETLLSHLKDRKGISAIYDCGKQNRTIDEFKQLVSDGFPGCKSILGK